MTRRWGGSPTSFGASAFLINLLRAASRSRRLLAGWPGHQQMVLVSAAAGLGFGEAAGALVTAVVV